MKNVESVLRQREKVLAAQQQRLSKWPSQQAHENMGALSELKTIARMLGVTLGGPREE